MHISLLLLVAPLMATASDPLVASCLESKFDNKDIDATLMVQFIPTLAGVHVQFLTRNLPLGYTFAIHERPAGIKGDCNIVGSLLDPTGRIGQTPNPADYRTYPMGDLSGTLR